MVFSSTVFLFLFLPLLLALYFVAPRPARNGLLLLASLLFYAWGARELVAVMLASIGMNWLLGLWIDRVRGHRSARWVLGLTVVLNLAPLAWFKYANFLSESLLGVLAPWGVALSGLEPIELPIGISFFTFQAMSYVIDVYRGEGQAQRNHARVALYVSLFPQLIAGPIVRYRDVAEQIERRSVTLAGFAEGVERFLIGLAKKLLIANSLAPVADAVFNLPNEGLSASLAWLGVLCYALQIYYDFSGYSDMAIGLGRMFGFRFMENFNYPCVARGVTDFWRRWHISLSTWFRDYLYIPLGGNRRGPWRTYLNLIVVFALCGLWHGANWTFLVWGLWHGTLLIAERLVVPKFAGVRYAGLGMLAHAYTLLATMLGWVFFRAGDLGHACTMLAALFGGAAGSGSQYHLGLYLDGPLCLVLLAGCLGATPWLPAWQGWLDRSRQKLQGRESIAALFEAALGLGKLAVVASLLFASAAVLSASTYNPFIYFQF